MTDVYDDPYYLGDSRYYTRLVLQNPPIEPVYLDIYKNQFGVDINNPKDLKKFLNSSEFLDFLCEFDFNLFCERKLNHIVKPFHVEWAQTIEDNRRSIILAPRDHGKSQFLRDYVLWCAYYKKRKNIMIISETLDQAKNFLSGEDSIKEQFESNENLAHLIPKGAEGKWSETLLKLTNGVRIQIAGYGQRLRGHHPDLILLDDVLSDQNSATKDLRKKVFHYYTHVIYPMTKKYSKLVIVGTAHHPNDLLFRLGGVEQYQFKKYQAVDEDTHETLWPERHSYEELQEVRAAHGELAYQREYQNNPISDNLRFFPEEILDNCKDFELSYKAHYSGNHLTHFGGDLSPPGGAKRGRGDYTVYVVFEVDEQDNLLLIHYTRFRDTPDSTDMFFDRQLQEMADICYNYKINHGFLEEVGFQAIYTKEFIRKGSSLPIFGFNVTSMGKRSESAGIPYLRGLMEKRKIRLPYATIEDQKKTDLFLHDFEGVMLTDNRKIQNTSTHDDCMSATWMGVESVKTITRPMFTMPSPLRAGGFRSMKNRFKFSRSRR